MVPAFEKSEPASEIKRPLRYFMNRNMLCLKNNVITQANQHELTDKGHQDLISARLLVNEVNQDSIEVIFRGFSAGSRERKGS